MPSGEALFPLLEDLIAAASEVHPRWTSSLERAALDFRLGDAVHHVCMAAADPHALLAREAYLSVLAYAAALSAGRPTVVVPDPLARVRAVLAALLDALEPAVSSAVAVCRDERSGAARAGPPVLAWCRELAGGGGAFLQDGQ